MYWQCHSMRTRSRRLYSRLRYFKVETSSEMDHEGDVLSTRTVRYFIALLFAKTTSEGKERVISGGRDMKKDTILHRMNEIHDDYYWRSIRFRAYVLMNDQIKLFH